MKKSFALILTFALVIGFSATAFAAAPTIMPFSDGVSFGFSCSTGGASVSLAKAAYKNDNVQADLNSLSSTTVSSTNRIAFRIRDTSDVAVSDLYPRSDTKGFSIYYYSGKAVPGNYKLWANAPSGNDKSSVSMSGYFYP